MRRLLSIGCNDYESLGNLTGAEADARRIFDTLLHPDIGGYDTERSRLLLSPSIAELRQAIAEVLFESSPIDTFTYFFAGHGGVRAGSFYMCVRDSRSDALSVTAQSLSDIFRSIGEAAPAQSNLIIDACESGGLIADLGALLKRDVIGNAGTPGITLIATSAQDQTAGETATGGLGTNAILDCIEGRDFINDSAAMLDLIEIGRRVSLRLRDSKQSPVVWGLNLSGPPRFCRNLGYLVDPSRPVRELIHAWPQVQHDAVNKHFEELWSIYTSINTDWDPRAFVTTVSNAIDPLANSPEVLCGAIERMAMAMQIRAEQSDDPFRPVEVCATLAVSLLPYLQHNSVQESARRLISVTSSSLVSSAQQFLKDLENDRYALLESRGGGLSDLYFLPLKISKMLGWIAGVGHLYRISGSANEDADRVFTHVLQHMLEQYSGSIQAMSDDQAPYWALALTNAIVLGLREEAEQLAGLLFYSLVSCRGQLACRNIPPEETLPYLIARQANNFDAIQDYVARPIETLAVMMRASVALDLAEIFDESLWKIDGLAFFAFLPSKYSKFGCDVIEDGQNLVWSIGQDVFRVSDFVRTWPDDSARPDSVEEAVIGIFSSLLFPDRVAWYCFDGLPV
ncbi:MAG: hypothetical protein AB1642_05370 [Pseudomonadota bacterium]